MPREPSPHPDEGHFGKRLGELRRSAGLSQAALARASGVSRRMIVYYEGRAPWPPGHVLDAFAEALGVSLEVLIGKKARKGATKTAAGRPLLRRLQQMEKLPLRDKRELLSIIDTYLERNRLLQKAS